ncbi:T9SS type B sorting domain-containing protein [Flavobacterium undicola]|uniref:T9SS type B sorting domain-containing protein n=1 Tax=Flavobacterium undicola TaxID=1932779 RepID=UPI0013788079|nr:T9SS type B sorting domain-containing protein [Flavobacterium undicola]MBA0884168.1 T9SS type B sorting domain-containing protein [Flavobacterium undicola]
MVKKIVVLVLFICFSLLEAKAQLCTGSLGDPVVKLDFGSGTASHGSALGTGITSYTYTTADFPSDGSYTIEKTTNTAGTWWTTTDHTSGGYMMVVNASFSTTDYFYKNTVTGLCPGTTYEFAAWIMNLLRSQDNSPPNITFTIEDSSGTILGTYNTGNIGLSSSAVWKQYGFYFTTPSGVSNVVIRMRNNKAGAAPGNDIALDDITFRACGPTVTSAIQNESTTNLEVCENESRQITLSGSVSSSAYTTIGYQWQSSNDNGLSWTDISGANSADYTFTSGAAGTFKYRLATADISNISSSNCRIFSNEITVVVKSGSVAPTVVLTQPNCDVPSGTISITAPSGLLYSIDGVNYQSGMVFSGLSGGNYNVTVKSGNCVSAPSVATISSVAVSNAVPTVSVVQPVICNNPYGTITVTSLDAEYSFDNGQTWQNSNVKTGFIPGVYLVKTRNSSLCETAAASVNIIVPPGYPPTPTVSVAQPDCVVTTGTIMISDNATAYSFDNGMSWITSNSKNNLVAGTYQVLIKNNLGCSSLVANEVVIHPYVNIEPHPVVSSSQSFCVQDNKKLNDIAISGTNIKWYDAPSSGNLLSGTTILTSRTYYASQTISICESERIPVLVTIQATAAPTGNSVQSFCSTQNATIGDLEAIGTDIVWYDLATNGTVLAVSTPLIDRAKYYATQRTNGCESVNRLAVTVSISVPTVIVNDVAASFCDDLNDGVEIVDLVSYDRAITLDTSTQIRFYPSLADAQNQNNSAEIVSANSYNLQAGITTLYARVDSNDKCYQVVKVVLTLFLEPIITIGDEVTLCGNSNATIEAGEGFDSYLWSTTETTPSITVSDVGNYSVTVTKNNGGISCSATKDFVVTLSNVAVISGVDIVDWTDNQNAITVNLSATSLGDYEYSLDGVTYQDENVFTGLLSGSYTVFVRDKNGCGIISQIVYILNYPKFFTPNGDGFNDTWAVKFSETEAGLKTRIFDRYGKFLKEFANTSSWDGTYNGHQLPSDDYWFEVFRGNNKIYRGHFAMKR